ncbi:hypothetical protein [Streptomyces sp. NPDC002676]
MTKRTLARSPAEWGACSARLPSRRAAPTTAARAKAATAEGDRVLLPGGSWRRVETIRVPRLFG